MSAISAKHWNQVYCQSPLTHVPHYLGNMANPAFVMPYPASIHRLSTTGGRMRETGVGSGHTAMSLAQIMPDCD